MRYVEDWVPDQAGNAVAGASVAIYLTGTTTEATIYSDDGVTEATNPLTTDSLGRYSFWIADGEYDHYVSGTGITPYTKASQQHYDHRADSTGVFDVTDSAYGALGDGTTDDSAAIQAAVTAASAMVGAVYFPPGKTFLIENEITLDSNVTLTGDGVILSGISGSEFIFRATTKADIVADGLKINGASVSAVFNGTAYPGIFGFYDCDRVTVRNCHIYDSGGDGVYIGGAAGSPCTQVRITGNTIEDSRRDGVVVVNVTDVEISLNKIIDTFGAGIDIEANALCTVERASVLGNQCHCTRTTGFDLNTWPRSLDCTTSAGTVGAVAIDGNYFSYIMPDAYLATAAADATKVVMQVFVIGVAGPVQFTNNYIYTNQMSDAGGNYGLVTFGGSGDGVTSGLTCAGNTVHRPETTPVVADGEGHAAWRGFSIRGCDNAIFKANRIKGSFNEPVWVYDCNNIELDLHVENTADSVASNVTSAITIDTCNQVRLTGYFATPDNVVVLDTVDGLLITGAVLKSTGGGVILRNQGAASGNVAAIGCMVNESDDAAFPNTVLTQNNDGNAITTFCELGTMDYTL